MIKAINHAPYCQIYLLYGIFINIVLIKIDLLLMPNLNAGNTKINKNTKTNNCSLNYINPRNIGVII
jgi:hypothetical protein